MQRQAQFDPEVETEAAKWIEAVCGKRVTPPLINSLRDGVALCFLVREILRGSIQAEKWKENNEYQLSEAILKPFDENPTHYLVERANLQKYLDACATIGTSNLRLCFLYLL